MVNLFQFHLDSNGEAGQTSKAATCSVPYKGSDLHNIEYNGSDLHSVQYNGSDLHSV